MRNNTLNADAEKSLKKLWEEPLKTNESEAAMSRNRDELEIGKFEQINRARNRPADDDPFEVAPIGIGTEMYIHTKIGVNVEAKPFKTKVVGYQPGQYLILETPRLNGVAIKYQENRQITVHYLAEKAVCSFKTQAVRALSAPFYMTIFQCPEKIEMTHLRSSPRLPVGIPFDRNGGDPAKEFIVNLGSQGALLKVKEKVALNSSFKITFYLPNGEAVNGITVNVKRIDISNGRTMAGVEFDPDHANFPAIGKYLNFVLGVSGYDPESYEDNDSRLAELEKMRSDISETGTE